MASADLTLCPDCGRSIPRDAVRGMCMACMMRAAVPGFLSDVSDLSDSSDTYGPWRVLAPAGEGAFGLVYEAEQHTPLHRRAALKVLKPGISSREVLARFAAEREALAVLDHPGIARVLDAGEEDGRPWFAAEWVDGAQSLTDFCQSQNLPRRERVRLFQSVCEAVAHAHQRGIIHRDLKPTNILVSADGVAKVIDFGIARATEQVLAQSTLVTLAGQVLGTPAYMSPEQAAGRGAEADTRSDIYSLGAVLYELLTGAPPFPRAKLESISLHEALRIVREDAPAKPSSLDPSLRGELEWITLKALEKDPSRRYETAAALSRDLGAWLDGGTVLAAPPSRAYQMRTFLRRHRAAALGVAAVMVTLLAATAGMSLLWLRAQRAAESETEQRRRAEDELWQSLVLTAQSERASPAAGGAARALELVRRAAAIRPGVELRDVAIAAFVQPDFTPERRISWRGKVPRLARDPIFHPDMTSACLVKEDGALVLVEVETCRELRVFAGPPIAVKGPVPVFSPAGNWLTLLDPAASGLPRLWSVSDGVEHRIESAPGVLEVLWNADDSVLALLRADSMERLEMPQARSAGSTALKPGWRGPKLSPDAALLAIGYDKTVEIRRAAGGELLHSLTHQKQVENSTWSHDSALLAVGAHDDRIHVWDVASGLKWAECNGHDSRPADQEFLPGSGLLLSGGWDDTLRLWHVRSGRPELVLPATGALWVRHSGGAVVSLVDWPELRVRTLEHSEVLRTASATARPDAAEAGVQDTAFSPDGRVLFTAGRKGITAWETASLRPVGTLPVSGYAVSVMTEADHLILTDNAGAHRVPWSWPPGAPALQFGAPVSAGPAGRCNHADARAGLLAVSCVTAQATFGERIELWRGPQRERAWDFIYQPRKKPAWLSSWPSLAVSPDGQWLATGGGGPCLPLLLRCDAPEDGAGEQFYLEKVVQEGAACAFSPDSRTLAVQSTENISLWDVNTRTLRHRLVRPAGSLGYLTAFSPDGRLLAALGPHWDLWLLDPATGQRLATLTPPAPALCGAICFSPDSTQLAAALGNGTLQVWDLPELRLRLAAEGLDWP